MVMRAYDWASENVVNDQPYRVRRMTGYNEGKLLVDGNTAAALGALYNGVNLVSWYPIHAVVQRGGCREPVRQATAQ